MPYDTDDTICAIASASGGGMRGVVRISGLRAVAVAGQLFESDSPQPLGAQRRAGVFTGRIRLSRFRGGDAVRVGEVPADVYLWPSNRSFTREPCAELHTIGSPPLLEAMLAAACAAGARLAEPGEFTLRAFLGGRLDLTQAEAVLGVIDASDTQELHLALSQLAGGLAHPLLHLRESLLQLLAELEAGLDFIEEDIHFISRTEVVARLQSATKVLTEVQEQIDSRHAATVANEVVLVGPPNAGKSSLFNALASRYASTPVEGAASTPAIVSPICGTTRDYLKTTLRFNQFAIQLTDTAGIDADETTELGPIDARARFIAVEQGKRAQIMVQCVPVSDVVDFKLLPGAQIIAVTKSDLASAVKRVRADVPIVLTSSLTTQGLDTLCKEIVRLLGARSEPRRSGILETTANRCRECVRRASAAIHASLALATSNAGDELLVSELRLAIDELGKIVGSIYTDDILDRIFKTFCIGK